MSKTWQWASANTNDNDTYRRVIASLPSSVVVVTTGANGPDTGATVSSFTSLSLDPPSIVLCLHSQSTTLKALEKGEIFAVNGLSANQEHLAVHFASGAPWNRFRGIDIDRTAEGIPVLKGAKVTILCVPRRFHSYATHTIVVAEVCKANSEPGDPMVFAGSRFGKFAANEHQSAYLRLASLVLSGRFPPGSTLRRDSLEKQLNISTESANNAIKGLLNDGIIRRVDEDDYLVGNDLSHPSYDTSLVMHLGVLQSTFGKVTKQQLEEWRAIHEEAVSIVEERSTDMIHRYLDAAYRFHEHFIGLSGNNELIALYSRLNTAGLLQDAPADRDALRLAVGHHALLLEAYENNDFDSAKRAIQDHSDWARHPSQWETAASQESVAKRVAQFSE